MSETEQRPDGVAVEQHAPNGAPIDTALPADIAADSIGSYFRRAIARVRAGESGVLPVIAGLILISIVFQAMNSNFLTAANLVNLLVQSAVFSLLAMAEVFVLLLGDIDLSVGFVAGLSAAIMAVALGPHHNWPLVAAGRPPARVGAGGPAGQRDAAEDRRRAGGRRGAGAALQHQPRRAGGDPGSPLRGAAGAGGGGGLDVPARANQVRALHVRDRRK